MAPGDGQAFRQPGSSQCMQPSLRISHSRFWVSGFTHSVKRISVNIFGVRSCGIGRRRRQLTPIVGSLSFHSRQADWQALQPMHFDTSISFATGVSLTRRRRHSTVAERRIHDRARAEVCRRILASERCAMPSVRDNARRDPPTSGHPAPDAIGSIFTRNALNSGVWVLASPTKASANSGPSPSAPRR